MPDSYKTIVSLSKGLYKEKGSKFLSFAMPASTPEEVKEILNNYRKEYYDARHVCYAYMLGHDRINFRANDDGEPSGTAGRPILGQINSRGLTNVLIIVVRYFGGILLGTGGLVTAYKEAAADALDQAEITERTIETSLCLQFDYILMNEVMRIIKDTNARVCNQKFENECIIDISIPRNEADIIKLKLLKIEGITLSQNYEL